MLDTVDTSREITLGTLSRVGGRAKNEDACGYWIGAHGSCFVVCDGAGGHAGGAMASEIAVKTILSAFAAVARSDRERLGEIMREAEAAILAAKAEHADLDKMSAAVAVAVINPEKTHTLWAQLGDTRLYLFRRGRARQLTKDHSVAQTLVDAGFATNQDTRSHPQRSVLYAALGMESQATPAMPDAPFNLEEGDALLLCSDGFWEPIVESDMESSLQKAEGPEQWLLHMEQTIVREPKPHFDNYTGLAVWLGAPNDYTVLKEGSAIG
jgi:PPM family protein phosphatase